MKTIKLTQGKEAIVDDDMFDLLDQYSWFAHFNKGRFYARRHYYFEDYSRIIGMHQVIAGTPLQTRIFAVDHINGDSLDNRKENLRIVTIRENGINKKSNRAGKLAGICLYRNENRLSRWQARITINGKRVSLGYYTTPEEAHSIYMKKVNELVGKP